MSSVPVIAIVDDDASVRVSMESLMRSLGYEARCYAAGRDLLASPDLAHASCLITDVQMPGMNGFQLHQALRARGCAVPVIFITAFAEERLRNQAVSAGAVGFLSKPFEAREIIACVEAALGRR